MCKLNNTKLISEHIIKAILENKLFYTQYQPIISLHDDEIYGYEALARFKYNDNFLPPDLVFAYCHKNLKLFYQLEYLTKKAQFLNRPKNKKLFINFDPHVFGYKTGINELFSFFQKQKNFTIELVENSHVHINISMLIDIFNKFEFEFAMDDFFKEDSMVSIFLLNKTNYIKLDKDILTAVKSNNSFIHIVNGIVDFAHSQKQKVILEGIETYEDLEIARDTKVDFIQGFLYDNLFINK
ncbi:MAG: EAL domain-containing protein [Arcobacteraceae bacterium]|nr:EAL domain-containing protein [Arcobacteraceae bacterium]